MTFTTEQLKNIIPNASDIDQWYDSLLKFLPKYGFDNNKRIAQFLAQCGHESGGFTHIKENLNYKPETLVKVFPKYFPNMTIATAYCSRANKQEAIANKVYANRMGNGEESSGDGYRYCGRGLIQLTGKDNYSKFAESIGMPLTDVTEYLTTHDGAVESACWFWNSHKLNELADKEDTTAVTRIINGGLNGLDDRVNRYNNCISQLGFTRILK